MAKPEKPKADRTRRGRVRPLAATLPEITARALGRRGFATASLITDWGSVVGDALAAVSQPEKLAFPRGARAGGVLHIRVEGGVATELQHLEPLVVERINGHFGYAAVARLKLVHAPLSQQGRSPRDRRPPPPQSAPPDPTRLAALRRMLAEIPDAELRAALERLGAAILAHEAAERRDRAP